jgi:hypothetical protein
VGILQRPREFRPRHDMIALFRRAGSHGDSTHFVGAWGA